MTPSTLLLASLNLLLNAGLTLAFTMAGVSLVSRAAGLRDGRAKLVLFAAPLVKAAYELARGIPDASFFWARLAGAKQELGTFMVGIGMTRPATPAIRFLLGAKSNGIDYPQSAADLLMAGLTKHVGAWAPIAVGGVLTLFVAARLVGWAMRTIRASRARSACVHGATLLETRALGRRQVRILVSDLAGVVPFAGGIVRPWVCIPRACLDVLPHDERDAVIAHELEHLRAFDGPFLFAIDLVATVFSFVPGSHIFVRAIRAQVELAADSGAARRVSAASLASALVRVAEHARDGGPTENAASLAFLRPGRLLAQRITTLLADEPRASSRLRIAGRAILVASLVLGTMQAITFGNP